MIFVFQSDIIQVQEVEIPPEQPQTLASGSDRLGWEEPGMGLVADIVRQNPELASIVSDLMKGSLATWHVTPWLRIKKQWRVFEKRQAMIGQLSRKRRCCII